jgi:hypothetical protein
MEKTFTNIYERCLWGNNSNREYSGSSGDGSKVEVNESTYIPFLKEFIKKNGIKTVVDLGSGDFRCGKLIYDDLDIVYTGYDAYIGVVKYNSELFLKPKYTFLHLDFCNNKEKIVNADLCILKDVIQHWSLKDIYDFLDYIASKFKYILIVNCCNQTKDNTDIQNGGWRPLSCDYLPLKKYNAKKLYNYFTKEVSLIET